MYYSELRRSENKTQPNIVPDFFFAIKSNNMSKVKELLYTEPRLAYTAD